MKRRDFIKVSGAAAAGVALAGCSVPQEAKKGPLLKGILCGHMHRFFEDRFSSTAIQYTVGATYNGDAQVVHFK